MTLRQEKSHYETLGILPGASPVEIRHAYKEMYQLYHGDSLASYSFFKPEERRELLTELDNAYSVLIDENTRLKYDQSLIESGIMKDEKKTGDHPKTAMPLFDFDRSIPAGRPVLKNMEGLKEKASENKIIQKVMAQENLSGKDLEKIRLELGLSLEVIAGITKIRSEYLHAIEEDRFDDLPSRQLLKGFLKSYVQCLGINPEDALRLYMLRIPS